MVSGAGYLRPLIRTMLSELAGAAYANDAATLIQEADRALMQGAKKRKRRANTNVITIARAAQAARRVLEAYFAAWNAGHEPHRAQAASRQ